MEQEELHQLLQHDELLQQQYDLLARIWKEKPQNFIDEDNSNAGATIARIIGRAANADEHADVAARRKRRRSRIRIYVAISFFAISIAGVLFYINSVKTPSPNAQTSQEAIVTKNGSRSRTLLSDGTTVWLNAGSKLSYENDFKGATREVRLVGEAFFEVVRQPQRPFIVHTSGIDIKVLGTTFNVKSYPEDESVETTLYTGVVEVFREKDSANKPILLVPNRKLTLSKQAAIEPVQMSEDKQSSVREESASYSITSIDSTKKESERIETAWVYSRLEIDKEKFEDVAKKLERWYNVTIVFRDEKAKRFNVTAKFETETVEQAFEALKVGLAIKYEIINQNEIFVSSSQ